MSAMEINRCCFASVVLLLLVCRVNGVSVQVGLPYSGPKKVIHGSVEIVIPELVSPLGFLTQTCFSAPANVGRQSRATSAEECRRRCARDTTCEYFAFHPIDSCLIVSDSVLPSLQSLTFLALPAVSVVRFCRPNHPTPASPTVVDWGNACVLRDTVLIGTGPVQVVEEDSAGLCALRCRRERTCQGISFAARGRACLLRSLVISSSHMQGVDSVAAVCPSRESFPHQSPFWRCYLANVQLAGHELHRGYAGAADDCASRCVANLVCQAATYVTSQQLCILYSNAFSQATRSSAVSMLRSCLEGRTATPPPPPTLPPPIQSRCLLRSTLVLGPDLRRIRVDSFVSCLAACFVLQPTCGGVSFFESSGTCLLKIAVVDTVPDPSATSAALPCFDRPSTTTTSPPLLSSTAAECEDPADGILLGEDYGLPSVQSLGLCLTICRSSDVCRAASYVEVFDVCLLKLEAFDLVDIDGWTSTTRHCTPIVRFPSSTSTVRMTTLTSSLSTSTDSTSSISASTISTSTDSSSTSAPSASPTTSAVTRSETSTVAVSSSTPTTSRESSSSSSAPCVLQDVFLAGRELPQVDVDSLEDCVEACLEMGEENRCMAVSFMPSMGICLLKSQVDGDPVVVSNVVSVFMQCLRPTTSTSTERPTTPTSTEASSSPPTTSTTVEPSTAATTTSSEHSTRAFENCLEYNVVLLGEELVVGLSFDDIGMCYDWCVTFQNCAYFSLTRDGNCILFTARGGSGPLRGAITGTRNCDPLNPVSEV